VKHGNCATTNKMTIVTDKSTKPNANANRK
jgi:hypothetical protein